jgi:hypothetical protein
MQMREKTGRVDPATDKHQNLPASSHTVKDRRVQDWWYAVPTGLDV